MYFISSGRDHHYASFISYEYLKLYHMSGHFWGHFEPLFDRLMVEGRKETGRERERDREGEICL